MARSNPKSVVHPAVRAVCSVGLVCCWPAAGIASVCGLAVVDPVLYGSFAMTGIGIARVAPVSRHDTNFGFLIESAVEMIKNKFGGGSP